MNLSKVIQAFIFLSPQLSMTLWLPQTNGLLSASQTIRPCKNSDLKMQKKLEITHESNALETGRALAVPGHGGVPETFSLQPGLDCVFASGLMESSPFLPFFL